MNRSDPFRKSVRHVLAFASGKGGVGKSTVALQMALSLQDQGLRVGLLDADVYGPSQPHLLGVRKKPEYQDGIWIPVSACGLQTMSMGYLVEPETPLIWRGPLLSSALEQMLYQTAWDGLDYLCIDLPPGTGDIPLTLSKKLSNLSVIIVTTPQEISVLDVRRAIEMFQKMHTPILGIVENMSGYHCPCCGHVDLIFGSGGGEQVSQTHQLPILGRIPIVSDVCRQGDLGTPVWEAHHPIKKIYHHMTEWIHATLSTLSSRSKKDYTHLFRVEVES